MDFRNNLRKKVLFSLSLLSGAMLCGALLGTSSAWADNYYGPPNGYGGGYSQGNYSQGNYGGGNYGQGNYGGGYPPANYNNNYGGGGGLIGQIFGGGGNNYAPSYGYATQGYGQGGYNQGYNQAYGNGYGSNQSCRGRHHRHHGNRQDGGGGEW